MAKVRIVSDGKPYSTRVIDERGNDISKFVADLVIEDKLQEFPRAKIDLVNIEFDVIACAEFIDSFWAKFESYERGLLDKGAGLTKEQRTGASIFYSWMKQHLGIGRQQPAVTPPAENPRDLTRVQISLTYYEWKNLVTALHCDAQLQPQLGRLAWMAIAQIEGALGDYESEKKRNGGSGENPTRQSEVVQ
jgi:hypothetical protein